MSEKRLYQASIPFYTNNGQARRAKIFIQMETLLKCVDFEEFRPLLEEMIPAPKRGRRKYDLVMLFKILVLEHLYGMSDETAEDQILVNSAFQYFLHIGELDHVPDARTIWLFRDKLTPENVKTLFEKFDSMMREGGVKYKGGVIADASFTEAPRPRITKEEKDYIEEKKEAPPEWSEKKKQHVDLDAKYGKKGIHTFFGYKDTAVVDSKTKLIRDYTVTSADQHDVKALNTVLPADTRSFIADSGYTGVKVTRKGEEEEPLAKPVNKYIVKRRVRGQKELSEQTKKRNKRISRIRCRVEHVFAEIKHMGGDYTRAIGMARNSVRIGLTNLAYNIKRFCFLATQGELCTDNTK